MKAAAALASATFAFVVWRSAPRAAPQIALGLFLGLIAGNQGAEVGRALAAEDAAKLAWFRIASACAAWDPVALLAFAMAHGALARRRGPLAAAIAAASGLTLAGATVVPADYAERLHIVHATLLTLFTATVYAAVLVGVARRETHHATRAGRGLLLAAFAIAALPVAARVPGAAARLLLAAPAQPPPVAFSVAVLAVELGLLLLVVVALRRWARRLEAEDARAALARGAAAAAVVGLLLKAGDIAFVATQAGLLEPPVPPLVVQLTRAGAAVRWLLFSGLVSVALLRHAALPIPLPARRRAARALLAVVLLALAAGALLMARGLGASGAVEARLSPAEWALLLAAIVASQGFQRLVDRVARLVYGLPTAGPRAISSLEGPAGDRYEAQRLLGRGSSGRALLAHDRLLDRRVVLKEILAAPGSDHDELLREARALARVRHPNVLVLHDVVPREDAVVLVTEHLAGGSLGDHVRQRGPLPWREGWTLLEGVAAGLAAIHAAGLVHRDVKPENVLLDADRTPKLADLGLAGPSQRATLGPGERVGGTPAFMAPEQRLGESTPASDVYAWGRVARACLRGPWPAPLAGLVARCLDEDPAARPADGAELLEAARAAHLLAEEEQAPSDTHQVSVTERVGDATL